ncbi:hypothetical protein [Caballeronia sp. LZ034LL]|uniref:hypothetical protein n=1 Tax=Caballeronia sp. LZ034LL TaxID=3038567 RepID=UPI00285549B4|nr:hypothetical protein [Caballeronia sp. LZ034LL]MDR5839340.1 hypothetical protein [Caballeronia sp. LZ034LL]
MAVQRKALFSANAAPQAGEAPKKKANFWINVGLTKMVDGEEVFLSLPLGIPLDTQEPLDTRSSNRDFAQMQAARNSIVEQLKTYAESMAAGDEVIIDLQVQLRRVKEYDAISTKPEENKFAMDLQLVPAKAA